MWFCIYFALLFLYAEEDKSAYMDYFSESLEVHKEKRGKLEVASKVPLENKHDLSIAYTPGVAEPCKKIAEDPENAYTYTIKGNTVAVVTDGSAVLGLGNIGGLAGLPVMEGKCLLFKHFADVDAFPICLDTQDPEEIIRVVKNIAPTFGGINLEDIAAPQCFEIERRLNEELSIPVFHDDQHGTAIVVTAALINALKLTSRKIEDLRIVMNGSGAAGVAVTKLLLQLGCTDITVADRHGAVYEGRDGMNPVKQELAKITNPRKLKGGLEMVVKEADMFIGLSKPGLLTQDMIRTMHPDPIIFAMANPIPEIMPEDAHAAGASIVATGRSDFPNQINNVLAFPGIFRGALDAHAKHITDTMKMAAAEALAALVKNPSPDKIIPGPFDEGVSAAVAKAVADCCESDPLCRR